MRSLSIAIAVTTLASFAASQGTTSPAGLEVSGSGMAAGNTCTWSPCNLNKITLPAGSTATLSTYGVPGDLYAVAWSIPANLCVLVPPIAGRLQLDLVTGPTTLAVGFIPPILPPGPTPCGLNAARMSIQLPAPPNPIGITVHLQALLISPPTPISPPRGAFSEAVALTIQ